MVSIMSNPSEDAQGTQLRVNKKLTTVCSGKRSRFSKPRPNLSISKRGESNIPANTGKIRNSEPETSQTVLNLKSESNNKKTVDEKKNLSDDNILKQKRNEEDITVLSYAIKNIKEDTTEKFPCEDANKNIKEDTTEKFPCEDANKNIKEDTTEKFPCEDANKNVKEDTTKNFPCEDVKIVSEQCNQLIANTNSEKLDSEEISFSGIIECQNSNTEKSDSEEISFSGRIESQNSNTDNASKNCDIETNPVKSSGTPLKSSESEKRSTSNITPTVIDKSKYPHLTSILSKKRTEPKKEAQQKRRRKFKKGDIPPERSKMTMADLIYWNPAKTDEPPKCTDIENETSNINVNIEEESVDDSLESENNIIDSVPKLVITEDGEINIDQSSLFVSRNIPQPISTEVVRKDDTTYSSFRKRPLTKHWTDRDTANFYRALSLVGADFSLMEQIFPNRTRRELKQKFKREEKFNIDLINKVLYESQTFDELTLNTFIDQINTVDDLVSTNDKDDEVVVKEKTRKKRTSKKTQSTNNETCDSSIDYLLEEITLQNEKPKNKSKKKNKTKKISDDEDVDIILTGITNYSNTAELKSSKRRRHAKKLPDDFINLESVEEFDIWSDNEANNQEILGASEKENSIESNKNGNGIETENANDIEKENSIESNENGNGIETENANDIEKENSIESNENGSGIETENANDIETENANDIEKENSIESNENGSGIETENANDIEKENFMESSENGNGIKTEKDNSIQTEKDAKEISSESACVILDKIMNGAEIIDTNQNRKENASDATVSLPVVTNCDEEYISVEYIKNDDSDIDLCMLSNVVAYEVVNTQTAPPKKRRKINPILPLKTRDYFLSAKISPASYTNYTPL